MTTKQLFNDVLCMGFDRRCTDGEADFKGVFASAVNRAQETLSALFPLYSECSFYMQDVAPVLFLDAYTLRPNRLREWSCTGARSYELTVRGHGSVSIMKNGVTHARHKIDSPLTEKRLTGEWTEECDLTLRAESADGTLFIHALRVGAEGVGAFYRCGKEYACPLSSFVAGALSLDCAPKDGEGRALVWGRDYRVENGKLYLSEHIKGQLNLIITRAPRRFDMECEAPDVRAEAMPLLPLLTAAYVWLDDDREKALFYLAMYRESLARFRLNGRCAGVGNSYGVGNGW